MIVVTDLDDLPDQRARRQGMRTARHQENGLDVAHDAVGRSDFQFRMKVDRIANATQNDPRADRPCELDGQAAVRLHLDVFQIRRVLDNHLTPLGRGENLIFQRVVADGNDQPVVQARCTLDDVKVAMRHRVEHSRKDGEAPVLVRHVQALNSRDAILTGSCATSMRYLRLTRPHLPAMLWLMSPSSGESSIDLSVDVAGVSLINPIMTASGTSGYGPEHAELMDLSRLGAFVTKAVSPELRKGNPPERVVETPGGMLNAIGLANVGLDRFVEEKIPFLQQLGIPVFVNVVGHCAEDFCTVCRRLDTIPCVSGLELNVSCPNVADGLEFGTDPKRLAQLVSTVRKEVKRALLIVKLSPNVTDIVEMADAAIEGGANALSVINTIQGMAINVDTWEPMLANRSGGLSGPAIKPIAVHMVHRVYSQVAKSANVPIIGMGGIMNWRDAVEFFLAGATAVAVGTALFVEPATPIHICEGLTTYLKRRGLSSVRELIGQLK